MRDIINVHAIPEGATPLEASDLTLEECLLLTKESTFDIGPSNEVIEKEQYRLFIHQDFETVQEYIDFYKNKGFYFVEIS